MDTLGPVLVVVSRVLVGFSLAFLVPLAWSLALGEQGLARVWAAGFGGTVAAGVALGLATLRFRRELQPKDGFLLVTLVWVALPACAAVPLWLTVPGIDAARAYFEAMSALTATGATALAGLDALPVSVNVWR